MKVYIQCDSNKMPINGNVYAAMEGFRQMGFETVLFCETEELKRSELEDIIVGGIGRVKARLAEFERAVSDIDYPEELVPYFKRKIWKEDVRSLLKRKITDPIFIKPVQGKLFDGGVIKQERDLIGKLSPEKNVEIFCSEVLLIRAEYRCYVRYGTILDIKRYKGELGVFYDYGCVQRAVNDFRTAPAGYAIDFGVTVSGETVVIEVNDGYSLGNYGIDPLLYAKLLSARWAELTGTADECDFI